jgi:hypothetical protein
MLFVEGEAAPSTQPLEEAKAIPQAKPAIDCISSQRNENGDRARIGATGKYY